MNEREKVQADHLCCVAIQLTQFHPFQRSSMASTATTTNGHHQPNGDLVDSSNQNNKMDQEQPGLS